VADNSTPVSMRQRAIFTTGQLCRQLDFGEVRRLHPLFAGIATGADGLHAYFVHSYHLEAKNPDEVLAVADYGGPVTAAVAKDNLAGTQFHPEKSQALGLALIGNFLKWKP